MKSENVQFLCSPHTGERLELIVEQGAGGRPVELLVGQKTGAKFPVREGIPLFLDKSQMPGNNRKQQKFYNLVAPFYDFLHRMQTARQGGEHLMRMEYIKELGIGDKDKVLEVSIGTGANLLYLPRTAQCFGIDISWEMLRRCKKSMQRKGIDVELAMAAAEKLPFVDNVFDVVFNVLGLRLFNDKGGAIREMLRVAKPGARITIVDQAKTGAPLHLLPREIVGPEYKEIYYGHLYCLSFKKAEKK
ncbi:type 11 methyltransferase [Thermincola ferriacetica]|uniref:Type 11 methyltransferase n=1 Tax=Thermincola ferriacetica TaxID=281456 RepID=A0A0L6W1Z4_9FIRM|nr:methyltransferase domain-containing protein [Thermincola ferriacetica]KNZ69099.1 type 11 methyltransferase [Thermincola ferriacetica]